jgi:hypothetical protein
MDVLAPEDPYREQQRCFSPRKVDRITYRRATESVQGQRPRAPACLTVGQSVGQPTHTAANISGRARPPDPTLAAFPGRGSALTRKRSLVQIQYRPPASSLVRRALRQPRRLRCFHVVSLASQTASLTDQLDGDRTRHPWPSLHGSTPVGSGRLPAPHSDRQTSSASAS